MGITRKLLNRMLRKNILSAAYARREYREMAAWAGFVAAILWPLYGYFCELVLGLPERMPARFALGASYCVLAILARTKRFGWSAHALWILTSAAGMIWLPWMLYLDSGRASYWVASVSFFGTILGFALRPWDLAPAILAAIGFATFSDGAPSSVLDIGIVAVFSISTWIGSRMSHMLWEAKRRIGLQNQRIRQQNNRLKELDRAKNVFTASVAHDLRTPLAVASSLASALGDEELSKTARNRLESLATALEQLRRQSENLFDLERFQLGVTRLDPRDVDMIRWIRHFEEGFASVSRARGLTFQVVLHATELKAHLDPVRMDTVLHNLVSNAIKFTHAGGHVEVHLGSEEERTLVLSIVDNGEGIPASALPHIFDRFQQVDRGPGTYTAGAGIGLALVREIVEAHGGTIRVESTPTLGSMFEIRIPGALTHFQTPPPTTFIALEPSLGARGSARGWPIKALVVEDDPLLRQILGEILEGSAQTTCAEHGLEGLRLALQMHPDIIVSDVAMPHMDGIELVKALRANPSLSGIPVILLSGDPVSVIRRLVGFEQVRVLPKPFDRNDLVKTMQEMAISSL